MINVNFSEIVPVYDLLLLNCGGRRSLRSTYNSIASSSQLLVLEADADVGLGMDVPIVGLGVGT